MSSLSDWLALLEEERLPPSRKADAGHYLQLIEQALETRDEAALSASIEILSEILTTRPSPLLEAVVRALAENTTDRSRRGFAGINLASLLLDRGANDEAEARIDVAEALFAEMNEREGTSASFAMRARLMRARGEIAIARALAEDAVLISNNTRRQLNAIETLIGIEFDDGKHQAARIACERWLTRRDSLAERHGPNGDVERILHEYALIGRRLLIEGDRSASEVIGDNCLRVAERYQLDATTVCRELLDELG